MSRPLVVIGDALLDRDIEGVARRLSPDAPVPVLDEQEERATPGGAALAATMAAQDGFPTFLVTALADDAPGRVLASLLQSAGVEVIDLGLDGPTPERIRMRAAGQSLLRLDRGGPPSTVGAAPTSVANLLATAAAVLVSDYGRGVARTAVRRPEGSARSPWVWDPHPQGPSPRPGMVLVTPNSSELARWAHQLPGLAPADAPGGHRDDMIGPELVGLAVRARRAWKAQGVAVTLGANGAMLVHGGGPPLVVPVRSVPGADPRGAGDRFAVAAAVGLAADGVLSEVVVAATARAAEWVERGTTFRAAEWVERSTTSRAASFGDPARPPGTRTAVARSDPWELAARVRAEGGTVVAAGGCFDLLHAGHVHLLAAARLLGDCLIVCLNSDASVRRVKGPERPLVPQQDRQATLEALSCVDAVAVFDEDTPASLLDRLRPHIFAKGGDYSGRPLSESDILARWGGQVVTLPYLDGRSSSALIKLASRPPN